MKIFFYIQLILGIWLVSTETKALDSNCDHLAHSYIWNCDFNNIKVKVDGAPNKFSAETSLSFLSDDSLKELKPNNQYSRILDQAIYQNITPLNGKWNLPAITLLKVQKAGVKEIHGNAIENIIFDINSIQWDDYTNFRIFSPLSSNRRTGRYNSSIDSVSYAPTDLLKRSHSDIQHWGLHEVFGIYGIEDINYHTSTLLMMVLEGQLSAKEYRKIEYGRIYSIKPFWLQTSEPDVESGGITGVEGGGDIVTASIKRYMLKQYLSRNISNKEDGVIEFFNFDLHYFSKIPDINLAIDTYPEIFDYQKLTNGIERVIVNISIRQRWREMTDFQKLHLAKKYVDYLLKKREEQK